MNLSHFSTCLTDVKCIVDKIFHLIDYEVEEEELADLCDDVDDDEGGQGSASLPFKLRTPLNFLSEIGIQLPLSKASYYLSMGMERVHFHCLRHISSLRAPSQHRVRGKTKFSLLQERQFRLINRSNQLAR